MKTIFAGILLVAVAFPSFWHRESRDGSARQRMWGRPSVAVATRAPVDLCDYLAAGDKVGNWSCTNGDGTSAAGSTFAIAAAGSPSTLTYMGYVQTRLNPTNVSQEQYFQSPSRAPPTGAFTACMVATKKEIVTADWIAFTDLAGTSAVLAEDNSTNTVFYGGAPLPSGSPTEPSEGAYAEAMQCIVFTPGATVGLCTISNTNTTGATGSCNTAATAETSIPTGSKRWVFGGSENGSAYNMRGLFRGAFVTEKALSLADLQRIGASVIASPPKGMAVWQDAANADGLGNSTVASGADLTTWASLGSMANPDAGSAAFVAVSANGTPHALTSGQKAVMYDGVYDQSISAGSKTALAALNTDGQAWDIFLTFRKRNSAINGQRYLFGTAEGQKGVFVGLNDYATGGEGTFWIIIGNGVGLRANYTSTASCALGAVCSVLIRSDGTNLKLGKAPFTSLESTALSLSGVAGDSFYDLGIAAVNPADAVGVKFSDVDVLQSLVYTRNLSSNELTQTTAYLAARAPPLTQRTWVALGDSLTEGATGAYPWPARLTAALAPSIGVANQGKSGDTAAQAATRYTNAIAGQGFYGLILMVGINDITADTPAATIWTAQNGTITTALAAGMPVVLLTTLPFGNSSDWSAPRQVQLDALLVSQRARAGVTLVDLNALMSTGNALSAAYDYGDGKHLNDTGAAFIATTLGPMLQ